jgi:hypothetical protein
MKQEIAEVAEKKETPHDNVIQNRRVELGFVCALCELLFKFYSCI